MEEQQENSHSCEQVKGKNEKGHWVKGVSGNPSGMPKGITQKYNKFKEDLMTIYEDTGGSEKLKKFVESNPSNYKFFIQCLMDQLPKSVESKIELNEISERNVEAIHADIIRLSQSIRPRNQLEG